MWRLSWVEISNFGPFCAEPQRIDLSKWPLLVLGVNRDSESGSSNGASKSTVLRAIAYALIGQTDMKGVGPDDLIRFGQNCCQVNLGLHDGSDDLVIQRGRKPSGPFLVVELNGSTKKQPRTNAQRQEYLLKLLGVASGDLGRDLFMNGNFLTSTWEGFASRHTMSSARFALVSSVLDQDVYSEAAEVARKDLKKVQAEISRLRVQIEMLETTAQEFPDPEDADEQACEDLNNNLMELVALEQQVEEYQQDLADIAAKCAVRQKAVAALDGQQRAAAKTRTNLEAAKKRLGDMDAERTQLETKRDVADAETRKLEPLATRAEESKSEAEQAIQSLRTVLARTKREIEVLSGQTKKSPISCPACSTPLVATGLAPLALAVLDLKAQEQFAASLAQLKADYRKANEQIETLTEDIRGYSATIGALQRSLTDLNAVERKLDGWESNANLLKKAVADLDDTLTMQLAQLSQMEADMGEEEDTSMRHAVLTLDLGHAKKSVAAARSARTELEKCRQRIAQAAAARRDLESKTVQISGLQKTEGDLLFWTKAFPDIRGKLMDEFIPELEGLTNANLSALGSPMRVVMTTTATTKAGNAVSEFNISVLDDVGQARDLRTLSQGEGTRVRLCMSLALSECLKSRGKISFDFLLLDEVTDGLDPVGVEKSISLLEKLGSQVIMVTHDQSLASRIPHTVTVQKYNGISTVLN